MYESIDLKKAKVVYKNTESAENYAKIIAEKLGCEFLSLAELEQRSKKDDEVMKFGAKLAEEDFFSDVCFDFSIQPSPETSLIIAIGGDGTLLKCARIATSYGIPVFGFNMGRLGFLAQADLSEAENVLEKIKQGEYRIEERMMLTDENNNIALNDIVIKNLECSRTSNLELRINDKLVCSYLADGLIVSTPTGSTAYNLSAGGAVIAPEIECITIVPICAHTLSARPVVVSSADTIEIRFKSTNSEFKIIPDGQLISTTKNSITIKKYDKKAKLLLLNSNDKEFYDILRDKLHWGVAPTK